MSVPYGGDPRAFAPPHVASVGRDYPDYPSSALSPGAPADIPYIPLPAGSPVEGPVVADGDNDPAAAAQRAREDEDDRDLRQTRLTLGVFFAFVVIGIVTYFIIAAAIPGGSELSWLSLGGGPRTGADALRVAPTAALLQPQTNSALSSKIPAFAASRDAGAMVGVWTRTVFLRRNSLVLARVTVSRALQQGVNGSVPGLG